MQNQPTTPRNLTQVDINQFDSTWSDSKSKYIDLTLQLKNYNEINNTNLHIQRIQNNELNNLNTMGAKVKSTSLKTKQEYMLTEYATQLYRLRCNIMLFTILVICGVLALCALFATSKVNKNVLIGTVITTLILWALIVYFTLKRNSKRRKYAWNQYYWKAMQSNNVLPSS